MIYLIHKTSKGKSLVMQGMASMLKGVTIVMVPLLGLGSDTESKCTTTNVKAYHLDEYRFHQHPSFANISTTILARRKLPSYF